MLAGRGLRLLFSRKFKYVIPFLAVGFLLFAIPKISYIRTIDFDDFNPTELESYMQEDMEIFGDVDIASLLALRTGKSLAFDMADTNDLVSRQGCLNCRKPLTL